MSASADGDRVAAGLGPSAHVDTFARDHLPPMADWPRFDFTLAPGLRYPARLNCAAELLDGAVAAGHGDRPAIRCGATTLTYGALLAEANRIAHALVENLGVVPGNRVLLRGPNNEQMVACWFAVLKAGAIAVTTMPLLRARELAYTLEKARVTLALCDARFEEELVAAAARADVGEGGQRARVVRYRDGGPGSLEALSAGKPATFASVDTASDDVALIAFTSGTTGAAKGTMHFHRDALAICDTFSRHVLRPTADDVFCGTPPLAFTFALGGLLLFPFRAGASAVLLEQPSPRALLETIQNHRATTLFTAPTMYRVLLDHLGEYDIGSLRRCVSAGETLPAAVYQAWLDATGIKIIDGIGSTEMLHIFISAADDDIRPGATGKAVPGYEACVLDDAGQPIPPGTVGHLAVRGPTGCRYLADPERQRGYVRDGWNLTGDAYVMDADGYFWFQARADDMIISSGYNIAGPEIENVLLEHPLIKECGVVGTPDPARGALVTAYVVLRDPAAAGDGLVAELQDFVKAEIAPYKYPRKVVFVESLPRTETGKLQRFRLRQLAAEAAGRGA
ncbi:MAG TPA: AMP-binding protein [Thermomicrobiales bacterium]|nr:AMP-binding protein [Thermomicrobiales bacterium]